MAKKKKKRRRGGPRKDSALVLEARQRHSEWVALRRSGASLPAIADKYGCSVSAVHAAILKYMQRVGVEDATEILRRSLDRLEAALLDLWPRQGERWNSGRIDSLCKMVSTQQKLLGTTIEGGSDKTGGASTVIALYSSPDFLKWLETRGVAVPKEAPAKIIDVTAHSSNGNGTGGR